jgi:uncharacterized protein (DUF302 family)
MSYFFSKVLTISYEEAIKRITETLKTEGFGILTEIDVKAVLKKKLNIDFRPYKILGACNPNMAFLALNAEERIGLMLPCNVIVQQTADGNVEVAAIDPLFQLKGIDNPKLLDVASEVHEKMKRVIDRL